MMPFSLFEHEIVHFALSLVAAGIAAAWLLHTKEKRHTHALLFLILLGAFIGEFLVDADHLFDYFLVFGTYFRFNYFFHGYMFTNSHKAYVPLHGWEWVGVLGIVTAWTKNIYLRYFLLALTLGLFIHLAYDTWYNHFTIGGYSLLFRYLHDFNPHYFTTPF